MRGFGYCRDRLFVIACALYALNRWGLKPHVHSAFFTGQFNDLLLIPCALPPVLWLQRKLGLRSHDEAPTVWEIAAHLVLWSVLFEFVGPHIMRVTGDMLDVLAYTAGAAIAAVWWNFEGIPKTLHRMSFDVLAPHYRWMEALLAGEKLQRCRIAWLDEVRGCRNVLIAGQGPGRFVETAVRAMPQARFTCVDASAGMLKRARGAVERAGAGSRVSFIHASLPEWQPPAAEFDLIATHFFLDCFPEDALSEVVGGLASAATADAKWLLADFQVPERGLRRLRARMLLALAYRAFRIATALPAKRLTAPDDALERSGFRLHRRMDAEWGLLHSDLWVRAGE